MSTPEQIPEGYLLDAKGRLVPLRLVKDVDRARHELVLELVADAQARSQAQKEFRGRADRDIDAFVQLSAEKYGVKIGRAKGNLTLTSFDGRYKIVRQVQDRLAFDERLQIAKELVDECIREWTQGSDPKIQALIEHAFQTDQAGKVSTERVLGLRHLDIDAPRWTEAMQAISDSVQVATSKSYLRFYERIEGTEEFRAINLDFSAT